MTVKIRDAVVDDVPGIVSLLSQLDLPGEERERGSDDDAYSRAFAAIAADPRQSLLVAVDDDDVVGTATLVVIPNLSHGGRPVAQLESVVVDRAWRGTRIGERLVDECLARAQVAGCFRVQLTSRNERTAAHRFWVRCGFTPTHTGFKQKLSNT
ncbi:MAG: GNAT family N-acetyltransferase [Deltaproteobacteria bacterium]|nr:GNAT family N-acetyltransferase [Deltaproteobacteria bacterium]